MLLFRPIHFGTVSSPWGAIASCSGPAFGETELSTDLFIGEVAYATSQERYELTSNGSSPTSMPSLAS
jgi:hypothetical protein